MTYAMMMALLIGCGEEPPKPAKTRSPQNRSPKPAPKAEAKAEGSQSRRESLQEINLKRPNQQKKKA